MKNIWMSEYTGITYEAPVDWVPQYGGWILIGTTKD